MTIQEAAKQAVQVQDACNSRGIARSMVEAMDAINDAGSTGTRAINQHPIVFMFLYKLAALNGHEPLDLYKEYSEAEAQCNAIACSTPPGAFDTLIPA